MPTISTPSKISGTKSFPGVQVVFSGSTSQEREQVVARILLEREAEVGKGMGPVLVPPYDHPDIMLGQGTSGLELERQFQALHADVPEKNLDAVMIPLGGGGLLSGNAIYFSHVRAQNTAAAATTTTTTNNRKARIFGCEPNFQGANDGELGLKHGHRIDHVSTLTIADGLRTPVGKLPWTIINDLHYIDGISSATEDEIKSALKLLLERAKLFVEPSSAVPLAVLLFNDEFRAKIAEWQKEEKEQNREGEVRAWDVAIILSGGNTTVEALAGLFRPEVCLDAERELRCLNGGVSGEERNRQRENERSIGQIGLDGKRAVEDVAG